MILENARAMRETLSPCSIRFTLRKLTVSDAGMYTLKAKNLIGEDVTQFYVQVITHSLFLCSLPFPTYVRDKG